ILQVGCLGRIAEDPEGQIVGKLAKTVKILGKFQIALRSRANVDCAQKKNLGGRARRQGLRNGVSTLDRGDLVWRQPGTLSKEFQQVGILRKNWQGCCKKKHQ